MYIKNIKLNNFRNYTSSEVSFNRGINAIYGENGSGKTNILEALYWISTTKSFRTSDDAILVQDNSSILNLEVIVDINDMISEFKAEYNRPTHRKSFWKNNNRVKKHSDIIGAMPLVLFSPEYIMMVKSGEVEFEVVEGRRGRKQAAGVEVVG